VIWRPTRPTRVDAGVSPSDPILAAPRTPSRYPERRAAILPPGLHLKVGMKCLSR
jgi:hypothetical protein